MAEARGVHLARVSSRKTELQFSEKEWNLVFSKLVLPIRTRRVARSARMLHTNGALSAPAHCKGCASCKLTDVNFEKIENRFFLRKLNFTFFKIDVDQLHKSFSLKGLLLHLQSLHCSEYSSSLSF